VRLLGPEVGRHHRSQRKPIMLELDGRVTAPGPASSSAVRPYLRKSSETRKVEAARSVAGIDRRNDFEMYESDFRLLARARNWRASAAVHCRLPPPRPIPKRDAFFFTEWTGRCSARATRAADAFFLASDLSWRISRAVQKRCFRALRFTMA